MSKRETMDCNTYMKQRVDYQIKWYNDNSKLNQNKFKKLRITEILLAAAIPVITTITALFPGWMWLGTLLVAVIGGFIAIIAGLSGMHRRQELWINYRTTCESLRREKLFFQTQSAPYEDEEGAFKLFVERVESLLSKERTNWPKLVEHQDSNKDAEPDG